MASASVNKNLQHRVAPLEFTREDLILTVDGNTRHFRLRDVCPALASAPQEIRENYRISPSGYGIHWPELDEDLSVDGLMGISHAPPKRPQMVSLVNESPTTYPSEPPRRNKPLS